MKILRLVHCGTGAGDENVSYVLLYSNEMTWRNNTVIMNMSKKWQVNCFQEVHTFFVDPWRSVYNHVLICAYCIFGK